MVAKSVLIGLAAVFILGGSTAFACQGKANAALDENFQKPDAGWGKIGDDVFSTSPQGLVIKSKAGSNSWIYNSNYTLDGTDFCAQFTLPAQMPTPADRHTVGDAGVLFWLKDNLNFYVATVGADASVGIYRLINNNWSTIYGPTPTTAFKTAPGTTNEIEIQVKGNTGTLIVNDTPVTTFHGQAPPNGGSPGVYVESADKSVTTWVFPRVQLY